MDNKQILADNLTRLCTAHDKTPTDISRDLHIPYQTVLNWFHAQAYPRINKLEALAKYFNIPKSALVEHYTPSNQSLIKKAFMDKVAALPDDQILVLSQLIDLWLASKK